MAYCVNCGVELEKSMEHCPLCGVEALNPKEPYDPSLPKPYSTRIVRMQSRVERRFSALIISVVFALAAVVCIMANLVYQDALTWSIYVVASLALIWVLALFPLIYTGMHPVAVVMLDICVLLLYLYVINLADSSSDWYITLAMPQVLLYGVIALIDVLVLRGGIMSGWQRYGLVVMSVGAAMMGLEVILDLYNNMKVELGWSWFVIIPAFALGLILFLIERKRELKDEILKRLRV